MSKRKWTDPQRHSFTARGGSVLVSAAAGSGKTAVLVERIIRRITDPVNPVDVDRLLVVTFTRAAAAEMRQRLSAALAEKMAAEPDNLNYQKQQMLLPRAYISTIHGYCTRLLQEQAGRVGLPVGFRVAEEGQTALLAAEALDTVLEENYQKRDPGFLSLAAQLCTGRDDNALREAVVSAYNFMQAQPFPDRWLQNQMDAYTAVTPLEKTPWMSFILRELDYIFEAADHYATLAFEAGQIEGLEPYWDTLAADRLAIQRVRDALQDMSYDDMVRAVGSLTLGNLPPVRNKDAVVKDQKQQVQAYRKKLKSCLGEAAALFGGTEEECRAELARMAPMIEALGRLVREYDRTFIALKREQKLLDYNDLEHESLRLLLDAETGAPTPLAVEQSRRFAEIMVDEYQDTNAAQDARFFALSRQGQNLFMVGDVKQSIYGFRQAMPAIFTNRRDTYTRFQPEDTTYPATITLENNFRSRETITETVNYLFGPLMRRRLGGVEYSDGEALVYSAPYTTADPTVDWLLVDKEQAEAEELTDVQAEARVIGRKIHELLDSVTIKEGEVERPLTHRDICILLRGRTHLATYVKELAAMGIPTAADKGGSFLSTPEIQLAVSLLRVVDNPLREVELAAVMLSPLFGFTPDDLAGLRVAHGRHTPLYAAVGHGAKGQDAQADRCRYLLSELERYRLLAVSLPADRFLETVYRDSGIESVFAARSGGRQRVANLRQLCRFARGFEQGGFRGLSAFVRHIDRVEEQGKDLFSGDTLTQDGVRVMTVHGSKGLEFPVVFLARLGGQGSNEDSRKKLLFHATAGIGMKLVDEETSEKFSPLPHVAVKSARRVDDCAEELRVWYVALTRAREKLVLVQSVRDVGKTLEKLEMTVTEEGVLPYGLIHATSPGDTLLMAALRHPAFGPLRQNPRLDMGLCKAVWQVQVCDDFTLPEIAAATERKTADNRLAAQLIHRLGYTYPYRPLWEVPAMLAASQLSHEAMHREHIAKSRPAFLQAEGLTPAQKGTAMHTFMQFGDYTRAAADLEGEIARLTEEGFLTQRQADALYRDKLAAFFDGSLYARMVAADKEWREYHFILSVPSGQLSPDLPPEMAKEAVIVQGIADYVFREGDGLVLVDYKTDRVKSGEELGNRYRQQMDFYQQALETILGLPVKERLLYSFHLGQTVSV